ncbi:MAG: response regulator [Patescibacteria group bacterium]
MINQKQKILIIEDETALLYALEAELAYGGFETISAMSGDEALKKIKEDNFSAVILDLILPGKIDGFEFLRRVKTDKKTKNIPVIIISNLGERENIERAKKLGAKDYLVKTEHSLEGILEKIKKILGKEK